MKGETPDCKPVINPETAPVVKRIFEMRASGLSPRRIANKLNEEHILCATDYLVEKGVLKPPKKPSRHLWSRTAVNHILTNQIYLGKLPLLRTTTVSHKNHKVIYKDESEWVIIENSHEPIISQELWDRCREVDNSVSRSKPTKEDEFKPLSGLMFCADCGFKIKLRTGYRTVGGRKNPHKVTYYAYNCTSYSLYGKNSCPSHYISLEEIETVVLNDIRSMTDLVVADEDTARKAFLARKERTTMEQTAVDSKKLAEYNRRIDELDTLIQTAYEDKVLGNMPSSVCAKLLEKYEMEQKELTEKADRIQEKIDTLKKSEKDVDEFIRRLKKYTEIEKLTREMCLELIEYITVDRLHKDKSQPREIHIYYKLIDKAFNGKNTGN